jgi:LuxR family transcriptional regulator, maltose regulon positive regulatory protein
MKSKEPSITKITRPGAEGIFPRERLFRLLDKGLRFPITWVTGPPGSGKTTLVASYLSARNFPCLWYQMDERDTDIATFFYYMGMAARKTSRHQRRPMPL